MKIQHILPAGVVLGLLPLLLANASFSSPWGFFGHRLINKMAVFTLPPDMIGAYKPHLEYLSEHAVDPDKRRYATHFEAVRHYIDLDYWGPDAVETLPRDWTQALLYHSHYQLLTASGDTLWLKPDASASRQVDSILLHFRYSGHSGQLALSIDKYRAFVAEFVRNAYYEERRVISCQQWRTTMGENLTPPDCLEIVALEPFSTHGMLPYFLPQIQHQLTEAFRQRQPARILRLSAEIGHYIGDAHVPLHTTTNYNGQLTGQTGIHAFWESRLPELFAIKEYNFFAGRATYIADIQGFYWEVVRQSHLLVDSVLQLEKQLSIRYPNDAQYCFEERLGVTVRTPCSDYARAYHEALNGMVERRMRGAIQAIGSAWLTAWVDAGQPDLSILKNKPAKAESVDDETGQDRPAENSAAVRPHED